MQQEFSQYIHPKNIQILFFSCRLPFPYLLFRHTWIVINKYGTLSRWEILHRQNACATSWGHLHLNFFKPFQGYEFWPDKIHNWKVEFEGSIEQNEKINLENTINFIENSPIAYPFCYKYDKLGPNSNTYTQWVIDNCKELTSIKLPFNALGKGFKFTSPNISSGDIREKQARKML